MKANWKSSFCSGCPNRNSGPAMICSSNQEMDKNRDRVDTYHLKTLIQWISENRLTEFNTFVPVIKLCKVKLTVKTQYLLVEKGASKRKS